MRKADANTLYINRELSWLSFNERVLQEAQVGRTPLIERVRFLGIFSNNLDEFYRVRVANLQRVLMVDKKAKTTLGFSVTDTLEAVEARIDGLRKQYDETFHHVIDALEKENIRFVREDELDDADAEFVSTHFRRVVRPELVPIMLGRKVKMPQLVDGDGYLAVRLTFEDAKDKLAVIHIPRHLDRFLTLPERDGMHRVMFLEDVIRHALPVIFRLFEAQTLDAFALKATRDAALDMDDDVARSMMNRVERGLKKRKQGEYVRILHDRDMPEDMLAGLLRKMKVPSAASVIAGDRTKLPIYGFPDADVITSHAPQPPITHPNGTCPV